VTLLLVSLVASCSGKSVDESNPEELYKDAEEDIQNDRYLIALDKLRTVKNKFPYSRYSTDAELRIGDVQFLQESFLEAAATYETFRELHPKHERSSYALFRIGEAYYSDIPGNVARDLTSANKAIDAFNEFLARFPKNPDTPRAKEMLLASRTKLAEKENYIADFYMRRGQTEAARRRYKKVSGSFADTEPARHAREKLSEIAEEKKE
jgi:outer membrane protein assembly factor BamD